MSLSQIHPVNPGDRIESAVWNAEFQNILSHPVDLISPSTGAINFAGLTHTGLLPTAITATSGATGQVLAIGPSGTAAWVDASATYSVRGLVGSNNTGTPNTKYDLAADLVVLRDPVLKYALAKASTGTLTNDTGVAGPAADGRDQAGAFSASSWVHFYFIARTDGTLSTVSSAVAPPTGPTLPTSYSMWAYAGAVRYDGSSHLIKTRMRGSWMEYESLQAALAGGTATVETAVSISALIPPNALQWKGQMWNVGVTADGAGAANALHALRYIAGSTYIQIRSSAAIGAGANAYSLSTGFLMPNQAQNFYYLHVVTAGSAPSMSVDLQGYQVPNGGE